jgi:hypothetical protein
VRQISTIWLFAVFMPSDTPYNRFLETPIKGGETPIKGGETPIKGGETPIKGGETPIKGGETPPLQVLQY